MLGYASICGVSGGVWRHRGYRNRFRFELLLPVSNSVSRFHKLPSVSSSKGSEIYLRKQSRKQPRKQLAQKLHPGSFQKVSGSPSERSPSLVSFKCKNICQLSYIYIYIYICICSYSNLMSSYTAKAQTYFLK